MKLYTTIGMVTLLACSTACGDDTQTPSEEGSTGMATTSSTSPTTGASSTTTAGSFTTADPTSTSTSTSDDTSTTGDGTSTGTTGGPLPHCGDAPMGGNVSLIDDFEADTILLPGNDDRVGAWYVYDDSTDGTANPTPYMHSDEGAYSGSSAAHYWGEGFTYWGAAIAVVLNNSGAGTCPYDASAYDGITFWARGEGMVFVHFSTLQTVPTDEGGTCENGCWDNYGADIELTDEWAPYTLLWEDLEREGWGRDTEFNPAELMYIHWQDQSARSFDIWLDDVHFYPADVERDTDTDTDAGTDTDMGTDTDAGTDTDMGTDGSSSSGDTDPGTGSSGVADGSSSGTGGMGTGSSGDDGTAGDSDEGTGSSGGIDTDAA